VSGSEHESGETEEEVCPSRLCLEEHTGGRRVRCTCWTARCSQAEDAVPSVDGKAAGAVAPCQGRPVWGRGVCYRCHESAES
jgi:hypothetical protein